MIICADDYGLKDDNDAAILELCQREKLSAVSCMAALERCRPEALQRLRLYEARVDIGLHLCLTDERVPWSPPGKESMGGARSFAALLTRALTGRIDALEVQHQVSLQYDLFVAKTGRHPDHIDGHLHAHQLPGAREAVLGFVLSLPEDRRPYIRNTAMPVLHLRRHGLPWVKALLIGALGSALRKELHHAGLRTNEGFAGIYDFKNWRKYAEYLPKFVESLSGHHDGILVVHPGATEHWRKQEYDCLRVLALPAGAANRLGKKPRAGTDQGAGGTATSAIPFPR